MCVSVCVCVCVCVYVCIYMQIYMYLNLGQSELYRERQCKGLKRKNYITFARFLLNQVHVSHV